MADEPIVFSRSPYTVRYLDLAGKQQTIRRVPPEKLHTALPTDVVELTQKHSDDFKAGDEDEVVAVDPHAPNTLQIKNKNGDTAFVEYFDTNVLAEVAPRGGVEGRGEAVEKSISNRYLLWP